ncbi:MAG: MmcB family DNA repair protein [Formivibrio sp.]|nr:MmcB family DNA repair protein [Formivibrio sp.]
MPQIAGFSRPQTTLALTRGVQRLLRDGGRSSLSEVPLPNGRRADLLVLGPRGELWIIEIKSSIADFRNDHKWMEYRHHCDQFYFAVGVDMPVDVMPLDTGLIVADAFGGAILRDAPIHKLSGAQRRVLLLVFAKTGAERLHRLNDPPHGDVTFD